MFSRSGVAVCIISLMFTMSGSSRAAQADQATVIVIPARPAVVGLAFDMVEIRNVSLVSYQIVPGTAKIVLDSWSVPEQKWIRISLDEYRAGNAFHPVPKHAVIIGADQDAVAVLEKSSSWAEVKRIPTLDVMNMVNSLNEILKFTPSEWKWLAKKHDLKLQDLNDERRRYGRYGKPGETAKRPMPTVLEPVMPVSAAPVKDNIVEVKTATSTTGTDAKGIAPEDK